MAIRSSDVLCLVRLPSACSEMGSAVLHYLHAHHTHHIVDVRRRDGHAVADLSGRTYRVPMI